MMYAWEDTQRKGAEKGKRKSNTKVLMKAKNELSRVKPKMCQNMSSKRF